MKKRILFTCFLILLTIPFPAPALALRGTPDTPYFGYGLRLDIHSPQIEKRLRWAAENNLDWIALDFDWTAAWSARLNREIPSPFGRAARLADNLGLTLVFCIQNPPEWAMTPEGPNPELTALLVYNLKQLYPNLQAVELYPYANTRAGWGANPNAAHYARVLQATQSLLANRETSLYILAGGLSNQIASPQDRPDVMYLQELYDSGARPTIISLRLGNLYGDPTDEPEQANSLRHFERIRRVMLANGQADALLWVTGFAMPAEVNASSPEQQSEWLAGAYLLMRSHLYFGSAFYSCAEASLAQACFLEEEGFNHPFLRQLTILIGEK